MLVLRYTRTVGVYHLYIYLHTFILRGRVTVNLLSLVQVMGCRLVGVKPPSRFSGDDRLPIAGPAHYYGTGVPIPCIQVLGLPSPVPSKSVNPQLWLITRQMMAGMTRPNHICMLLLKNIPRYQIMTLTCSDI